MNEWNNYTRRPSLPGRRPGKLAYRPGKQKLRAALTSGDAVHTSGPYSTATQAATHEVSAPVINKGRRPITVTGVFISPRRSGFVIETINLLCFDSSR